MFVNADGLLFIIKSAKKEPRALTRDEEIKFGGKIKPNLTKIRRTTAKTYQPKKEKGVTIKVVEKEEQ